MREYFYNMLISLLTCFAVGVLGFLIGRDGGPTAGAIFAGGISGVLVSVSYCLGGMMNEDDEKFNGKRLLAMLVVGVLAGVFGGLTIGIG